MKNKIRREKYQEKIESAKAPIHAVPEREKQNGRQNGKQGNRVSLMYFPFRLR